MLFSERYEIVKLFVHGQESEAVENRMQQCLLEQHCWMFVNNIVRRFYT